MSGETEAALSAAAGEYTRGLQAGTADLGPLTEAATAHVSASRPHEQVLAEYTALQDARDAGEPFDAAAFADLGQELGVLRIAVATLDGHPPGLAHVASAAPAPSAVPAVTTGEAAT
jgi:hypothetical protein